MQHYLNSMHIFCRLRKLGMGRNRALYIACLWERFVHPVIYPERRPPLFFGKR